MVTYKCKICSREFDSERSLHLHIAKGEKITLETYYQKYFPRYDWMTKELIEYKNPVQYLTAIFNNRNNLIDFCLKNKDIDSYIVYQALFLSIHLRTKEKGYKKIPSTVEARTSLLPSPALVINCGFDYVGQSLCKLSLKLNFDYIKQKLTFDSGEEYLLIDTREQKPLDFDCKTLVTKLDFGDYTSRSHYKKVFVERKSLVDLYGTLSSGYDRFLKELERCKEMDSYLVIVVEDSIETLLDKNSVPVQSKITPEFIAHRVREICQGYDCAQFLFVKNRNEMNNIVRKIFLINTPIKGIDLQWAYDLKLLR